MGVALLARPEPIYRELLRAGAHCIMNHGRTSTLADMETDTTQINVIAAVESLPNLPMDDIFRHLGPDDLVSLGQTSRVMRCCVQRYITAKDTLAFCLEGLPLVTGKQACRETLGRFARRMLFMFGATATRGKELCSPLHRRFPEESEVLRDLFLKELQRTDLPDTKDVLANALIPRDWFRGGLS